MYKISKEFHFCASHQLECLAPEHPCSRVHGHNYIVIVELQGTELNKAGFILDYREMDSFKKYIDDIFDHRHLNDVLKFNPSAENMAKFFYGYCKTNLGWPITSVSVKETPKTIATYHE